MEGARPPVFLEVHVHEERAFMDPGEYNIVHITKGRISLFAVLRYSDFKFLVTLKFRLFGNNFSIS